MRSRRLRLGMSVLVLPELDLITNTILTLAFAMVDKFKPVKFPTSHTQVIQYPLALNSMKLPDLFTNAIQDNGALQVY
ncbi:hypothetical protein C8R41DRAFT_850401 [Lentinula lateritia]|uniref:Uncharacterized protein n=1 Tax=Lentinula lateritia TaxID=40482 RepID=A0ABQ8V5F2_9AGAR|nr:hypothetical protein C8R41DRAFT_850401 [Lentinula lateritia]